MTMAESRTIDISIEQRDGEVPGTGHGHAGTSGYFVTRRG